MRLAAVLVVVALVGALAGCSRDSSTDGDGFVSGDGRIRFVAPADREPAPDLAGPTLDGERLKLSQFAGRTVVVNVWGAWCAPCRREAPALIEVARRYADRDVQFVGIAIRDRTATAKAFADRVGMTYPSIDDPSSQTLLGFADSLPSGGVPTTWVIDEQGRVAARAMDEVSASTLSGLIDDVQSGRTRLG